MSFLSRPSGRMRQQNNHLSYEIQTLFFLQPHFKIFEFFNFCKIFLVKKFPWKLFDKYFFTMKNDILCDLMTMHKCHDFFTVVEKRFFFNDLLFSIVYFMMYCKVLATVLEQPVSKYFLK
jgi:hypothetical protein